MVGMTAASFSGMVGCGSGEGVPAAFTASELAAMDPTAARSVSACDAIRLQMRQDTIKTYGFDQMIDAMKKISQAVQAVPTDQQILIKASPVMSGVGQNQVLEKNATDMTMRVYNDAIDRAGLSRTVDVKLDSIKRSMLVSPTPAMLLSDGFIPVISTSPMDPTAPAVGDVTDAYLAVSADQSHYEFILVKTKSVARGPNNGFNTTGEYLSMSQYIESKLPSVCTNLGSGLMPDQVNQATASQQ